jgi:hypothetical protein
MGKSGKPCERLIAPCCEARADMTVKIVVANAGDRKSVMFAESL